MNQWVDYQNSAAAVPWGRVRRNRLSRTTSAVDLTEPFFQSGILEPSQLANYRPGHFVPLWMPRGVGTTRQLRSRGVRQLQSTFNNIAHHSYSTGHTSCTTVLPAWGPSMPFWHRSPHPGTVGTKTLNTHHTRLRVGLSTLHAHLFQINLTSSPACSCGHNLRRHCPLHTLVPPAHKPQN